MIVVIDNYDSFTYNLVQYLGELGATVEVRRNDEVDVAGLRALRPDGVLISPGPGRPEDAGVSVRVFEEFDGPIFGVCLGHQGLAQCFGAKIVRAGVLMHGRTSEVHHAGVGVFVGLDNPLTATRYHSLIVERESIPDVLEITAWTAQGEVMGLRHKTRPIEGVQFHPESFLTHQGHAMLQNWLTSIDRGGA